LKFLFQSQRIIAVQSKKFLLLCGVSLIRPAPFTPPGAEASKGTRLSGAI